MIRLEGDTLPLEAQGAVPPILFGELLRDVPGIPVQVGWTATLADNCGIDAAAGTLRLGGADLPEVLAAVPPAGVVQIENEWLRYSAIATTPPGLVIAARGYRATDPAAHAKGATVYFVETRPLYVLAYAPPGCSYPPDMIVQLRVNDNAETPPCTIRLQDERLIPGVRLVTVEFDASRAFYVPPAPALPAQAVVIEPAPPPALTLRGGGGGGGALAAASFRGTVTGVSGGRAAMADPREHLLMAAPALPSGPPPGAVPFAGTGRRRVLLRGALGHVTADCRGLRDTASGRYSGVALGRLVQPAAIVRVILEETYGETDPARYHEPTWTATAARHAERKITWRLAWAGAAFDAFRQDAQTCGQADLYLDDEGRWRYAFRDPLTPPVATLTPRELVTEPTVGWTPGRDVVTELEVAWGAGVQGGTVTLASPARQVRHGRNHGALTLPYAATEPIARQLGRYQLARQDHPRQSVTVRAAPVTLGLTLTDRVFVETALLELYGAKRVPFEIVGITDRGDQRVLALLEGDPLARELALSGSLLGAARVLEVPLSGAIGVGELVAALSGTLLRAAGVSRTLAGTLVRAATPLSKALAGTLAVPTGGLLSPSLAGTWLHAATPKAPSLAGTWVHAATLSKTLSGSLDTTPTVWDAAGAVWDAAGAVWDVAGPPTPPVAGTWITKSVASTLPSFTQTYTTGAGETYLLVQFGIWSDGATGTYGRVTGCTFGATALTKLQEVATGRRGELWGGTVPAGTTATLTATFADDATVTMAMVSLAGVVSVGAIKTKIVRSSDTPDNASSITFDAGDVGPATLGVDFLATHGGDSLGATKGTGQTLAYPAFATAQSRQNGSTAVNLGTFTWTGLDHGNNPSVQIAVPLKG